MAEKKKYALKLPSIYLDVRSYLLPLLKSQQPAAENWPIALHQPKCMQVFNTFIGLCMCQCQHADSNSLITRSLLQSPKLRPMTHIYWLVAFCRTPQLTFQHQYVTAVFYALIYWSSLTIRYYEQLLQYSYLFNYQLQQICM